MKTMMTRRPFLKSLGLLLLAFGCLCLAPAAAWTGDGGTDAVITAKAFPFFRTVARNPALADGVRWDAWLHQQHARQRERMRRALDGCADAGCYAEAARWSPGEIEAIGNRLAALVRDGGRLGALGAALRAEAAYPLYASGTDADLVRSAWADAARGVNRILEVYVGGKKPLYPAIDAISFQEGDPAFREKVRRRLAGVVRGGDGRDLFFGAPLEFALWALAINGRDEAARYEPLDRGANRRTVGRIPAIDWHAYAYSMILVPGQGPEREGEAISPGSVRRCREAAERFRRKLAPILVVSGGHVHPNQTPFSEAVEMKKYLVRELGIPEEAILIDPHARHSTTNMRNAARLAYRYGIPDTKKILIVTDPVQNGFLAVMQKRFLAELGYLPYLRLEKMGEEESEFYPVRDCVQPNPLDPLDP
jgi:hypothetical protein